MADLPQSFLDTMQEILGEDYEAFLSGFGAERNYGLRVNTGKITLEEFERIAPFPLKKIPWIPNGYFYEAEDAPARHPFYNAGLYYLQEPSAMTPASRLPVKPGERVLDLCAAPGGKATQLGSALKGEGLLVANDINTARARALLRNLELFGISNSFVTSEPPHVLAKRFPEYFHKIMVDAPCSGEGMFRKNPAVVDAWLEKGPEYFSKIQREIVVQAADMLLPGGMMLYSTCTFSPLENEKTITHLLSVRPEMEVVPMEDYEGFSEGLTSFAGERFDESCRLCRRIWPHKMAGEGHFMALLKKKEKSAKTAENKGKTAGKAPRFNKEQKAALEEFFSHIKRTFVPERIDVRGDSLYYLPEPNYDGRGLHFLRNGLFMGELKKKRFEPSQPLALALSSEDFDQVLEFRGEDERLARYLKGETLLVDDMTGEDRKKKGWYLVTVEGYPLGFGKLVNGVLKNKYPPGWRKTN
ncbi:MAG: RsmB/NOP family class I SAM-dependent RNA methyltransferase [Eubacterium sp.]|nr:RsmB/NOP family class I SAM-dependent RNA methyltransferase [Eubacterium sp.]MDD7210131.1 RsmB/NOP family class I SAM-dependent RNA methyltransferase [Lachnospiraceae bacterium]MDY5498376.1 RsmB/NOP family class I SAM-dependent RNA methyltransferase [Anaerobutyricum sp.]